MEMTKHNTEQAARGFLMYQLAIKGYKVQLTDSRFPTEDMLVVSPKGKHFGIDIKGQQTKSFWQYSYKAPQPELFYAFVFVPPRGAPRAFLTSSETAMQLWSDYKTRLIARGAKEDNRWGVNWKTVFDYEDKWDIFPE